MQSVQTVLERAHVTFQKPIDSPFHFSTIVMEFRYIYQPIGRMALKTARGFSIKINKKEKNQSDDVCSIAGFEK